MRMRRLENLIFAVFLLLPGPLLCGELDLSGYFENRAFVIENPDEQWSWENLGDKLRLGDYNRLRLILKALPSKKVSVYIAVDLYSYYGMINTPLWVYIGPTLPTSSNIQFDVDRAYMELNFKRIDLYIGKQRVPLGVSYLWAPLDIFGRVNIFDPKEEKVGVNAFKVYLPLGASTSLTGVFAPDMKVGSSTSAFRAQTQVFGIDAALTLIRLGADKISVYGLDLRGENFVGWWLEAGYFITSPAGGGAVSQKQVKAVLGFDYTFPLKNGLYWLNEYYYDETGQEDPEDYDYKSYLTGKRFTLGRKLFLSMLRYPFNDFLNVSLSYIANWGDGSFIISPALQYDISQSVRLSSGFFFPCGPGNSEFKNFKENTFFLWLKINF